MIKYVKFLCNLGKLKKKTSTRHISTFFILGYVLLFLTETALHFATVPVSVQGCLQAYMLQYLLPPPMEAKVVHRQLGL